VLCPFLNRSSALLDINLSADAGPSGFPGWKAGDGCSSGRGERGCSASGLLVIAQAPQ
jgi:hypothetical protein